MSEAEAEAEALLGEISDCYNSSPEVRAPMTSAIPDDSEAQLVESLMSDKSFFVEANLLGVRQDPDASEILGVYDLLLHAMRH